MGLLDHSFPTPCQNKVVVPPISIPEFMNHRYVVHLPDRPLDVGGVQSARPSLASGWSDTGAGLLNELHHLEGRDRHRVHAEGNGAQLSKT